MCKVIANYRSDGKADYLWTRPLDGRVEAWLNRYPELPAWYHVGEIAGGVGTSGANVRHAQLMFGGRTDYVAVDPNTGALAAWLSGCNDVDKSKKKYRLTIAHSSRDDEHWWSIVTHKEYSTDLPDLCNGAIEGPPTDHWDPATTYPDSLAPFEAYESKCFYRGSINTVGHMMCEGFSNIHCSIADGELSKKVKCPYDKSTRTTMMTCSW